MPASTFYLAQHGLALSREADPERPLSAEGRAQTRAIAGRLRSAGIPLSAVFHSGKLRAQQTARIFAGSFDLSEEPFEGLAPNDPVDSLIARLNHEHALYIGHLPQLQKLADTLLSGRDDSHVIRFCNSAVLCLQNAGSPQANERYGSYQIAWYFPPALND